MPKVKFDYFGALERQGEFACQEAALLVEVFKDFDYQTLPEKAAAMHEIENAADVQNHEIFTHVATEFLTPIEKEDIVELAHRLDDIVDYIDDVIQLLYMYNIREIYAPAYEMTGIISRAAEALVAALKEFRNFRKNSTVTDYVIAVNDLEEEADTLYAQSIRDLYTNYVDEPVFIMSWGNVFLRMERCMDACENVVDMLGTIVLKNS